MGIVARQSFKAAIVTYAGILMGVVNQLLIYPFALSVKEYGVIQFVIQTASFFTPLLLLGTTTVFTKFYPKYSDNEESKQSLYSLLFGVISFNVLMFLGALAIFYDKIAAYYTLDSDVSNVAIIVLFGISAITPFISASRSVAAVHGRISIPSMLAQVLKFVLPLIALAYYYNYFDFELVLYLLLAYHFLLVSVFLLYMRKREPIKLSFSLSKIRNNIDLKVVSVFAVFSLLTGVGATLTNQIDVIMITSMKGSYQNGLYAWSLFISNAIAIPYSLLVAIATPMIAKFWNNDDIQSIGKMYKNSSSTLLVLSLGAFLSFWLVIDDLFAIMPKGGEYRMAKTMVLMLCSAQIVDLATGLNTQILAMSKDYKKLLILLLATAGINIALNSVLIPEYGIEGSGIATVIAIVFYNAAKYIFLRSKYGLEPFTKNTLIILLIGGIVYGVVYLIPKTEMSIVNMFAYSGLFVMIYGFLVYRFRLAPELNEFVNKQLLRIGIRPFDN